MQLNKLVIEHERQLKKNRILNTLQKIDLKITHSFRRNVQLFTLVIL